MLEKSSLYKLEKRLGLSAFGEYPVPLQNVVKAISSLVMGLDRALLQALILLEHIPDLFRFVKYTERQIT